MALSKTVNQWLKLHEYLTDVEKVARREEVIKICGWSKDKFYRRLKEPWLLSQAEKTAIGAVYNLPLSVLFPETLQTA